MRKIFILVFILSTLSFAQNDSDSTFGSLFIIGGGSRPNYMIEEFVKMAGGDSAKIIVIPTASSEPAKTGKYQSEQFTGFGASADYILTEGGEITDSITNKFEDVTGVFFSGGDQSRLTKALLDSEILDEIKKIFFEGGVIGGTSAGAAVMSKIMITGDEALNKEDEKFINIQKGNIITSEGFGFVDNAVVDQHFLYRKRHNRLISLVLENPAIIGIGIDESTAAIFSSKNRFRVLGENQVIVYSAVKADKIETNKNGLFSAENLRMDILTSGCCYDIDNKNIIECD